MKAHLMYRDRDFDPDQPTPPNAEELARDLELDTLFAAMSRGDKFLMRVAMKAMLTGDSDLDTIHYRQSILQDCINNAAVVREIYQIPLISIENKKSFWRGIFSRYPSGILNGAIDMMQMFMDLLGTLRRIADEHADKFESEGFRAFFAMIAAELDDEYFATVRAHLKELTFSDGVLISAELGKGNEGADYVLRRPNDSDLGWLGRIFAPRLPVYSFRIHPRDDSGTRALGELRDRGVNLVANALAQSADHIDSFLNMVRVELGFYIGCLNLYEQLDKMGAPITFPTTREAGERRHTFDGLYDACLALTMNRAIVGNAASADHKDLVIITGANQGGKSTFLRSIGLSQLMMQCGMFVPADSFCTNVCEGVFSHFKREEDVTMESGKLDEELSRMSDIVSKVTPNSLVLFNESFSATNEREGSEIARQIVSALLDKRIKVFFVSHMYEFTHCFSKRGTPNVLFLRAERRADGIRTYKLLEGEPLSTSYGVDLYRSVFGAGA